MLSVTRTLGYCYRRATGIWTVTDSIVLPAQMISLKLFTSLTKSLDSLDWLDKSIVGDNLMQAQVWRRQIDLRNSRSRLFYSPLTLELRVSRLVVDLPVILEN
jgi:hypothetical protein